MAVGRKLLTVLVAVVTIGMLATSAAAAAEPEPPVDDWIVTLEPTADPEAYAQPLADFAGGDLGLVFENVLGGFAFTGTDEAAAALESLPWVSSVSRDRSFSLTEDVGFGVVRIDGLEAQAQGGGSYRGSGIRIAVIDSGADLDHPDLVDNIDPVNQKNCVSAEQAPEDDNSHGTHVAGIAAAAWGPEGNEGVVGVAPEATVVVVKSFDGDGNATTEQVLCGINYVAGLAGDGMPTIANMSFGETGVTSECDDEDTSDVIHEAVCDLADVGVIPVAGAGNNAGPVSNFIPAAFPETIAVSALTDRDGKADRTGGCDINVIYLFDCDDSFADYSNYGAAVDVIAPGSGIYSTVPVSSGSHDYKSGTSMATPHVSGVIAMMLSANPDLTTDQARFILQRSGECPLPFGSPNLLQATTCLGQGSWDDDSDSTTEPLVNADRALQDVLALMGGNGFPPLASFTPSCVEQMCWFTDTSVDFEGPIVSWAWDFGDGQSAGTENPSNTYEIPGTYTVELTVQDAAGNSDIVSQDVTVPAPGPGVQGDWVGSTGADGFVLGAWEGGEGDLSEMTYAGLTLETGFRHQWSAETSEVRAVEAPDESVRKAGAWYGPELVTLNLDFTSAYSGPVNVYALDWDSDARRQTVTLDDGNGEQSFNLDSPFDQGAWMTFDVDVIAGTTVTITAEATDGPNAVISAVTLGNDTATPLPPAPPTGGDWVGLKGADGYVLSAWNSSSDEVSMQFATVDLVRGARHRWSASVSEERAVEAPDQSHRRAAAWYDSDKVLLELDFTLDYAGPLKVYALDWDGTSRRQTVTVDDGRGPQSVGLAQAFDQGAWMTFDLDVTAGQTVTVQAVKNAGVNAVVSAVMVGGSTPTPPPPAPPSGGDWVGVKGADGHVLAAWESDTDLDSSPFASATLVQGSRHRWEASTPESRAIEAPDESHRRAAAWYDAQQVQVDLDFVGDYSGPVHVYSLDWDGTQRRQIVSVDDGSGPEQVSLIQPFNAGAWASFDVDVTAGSTVTVTAANNGGVNAVISAILLGDDSATPPPDLPPTAAFSVSCTDLDCQFTDQSTDAEGDIASWSWSFGDPDTSTAQSPSHSYSSPDTYSVSLTVTDEGGNTDFVVKEVTVPMEAGPGVQGDWVGANGADGYVLAGWNSNSDLVSMPLATFSLDQASRHRWDTNTADVRAVEAPDESHRRATTWYHS
ncbi:MAG: S8 family serine peptidase, partial [Acidimicrobiales bacterium]